MNPVRSHIAGVRARPSVQQIEAQITRHRVGTVLAIQHVVAVTAGHEVVAGAADQQVVPREPVDRIVAPPATDHVVEVGADQRLGDGGPRIVQVGFGCQAGYRSDPGSVVTGARADPSAPITHTSRFPVPTTTLT